MRRVGVLVGAVKADDALAQEFIPPFLQRLIGLDRRP
jgi:hypothetical protein